MANRAREMYIEEGNAVRKTVAVPKRQERPAPSRRRQRKTFKKSAIKAEQSMGFDLRYTVVLALMLVMVILSCVIMLTVQGSVENKERKIESLQEEIQDIEADNTAYENKLNSMYSLEDIYNIATGELGMVYSENGSIIYYESEQGDYVKQYSDVPKTAD
ncbi:MAG: hypothetical protein K6E27_04540 [Eubacterium sp.]|nr:hypothetical protein [Eubacterium sp.]